MSHTYVSELVHVVFSTKERRNTIDSQMQERLWSLLGGIARKNGFKTVAVEGPKITFTSWFRFPPPYLCPKPSN